MFVCAGLQKEILKNKFPFKSSMKKRHFLSASDQQQWQGQKNYETLIFQDVCVTRDVLAKLLNSQLVSWINPLDRLSKIQRVCAHHVEHLNYSLLCQKFLLRKQWEDMIVTVEHLYKNHSCQKGPEVAKNLSASMTRAVTRLERYSMHSLWLRHCFPKSKYSN